VKPPAPPPPPPEESASNEQGTALNKALGQKQRGSVKNKLRIDLDSPLASKRNRFYITRRKA